MVKKLHSKSFQKKVWIILTILILPAFVIWGSGSIVRSQRKSSFVGKINGRKVTSQEYEESLSAVTNMAIIQFGDNFSEIQKYLNLSEQAWERLILLSEAKKRKIKTSDQEVIETIQRYPVFRGKAGFDNRIYSQYLNYVFHIQPREFEEQTRKNITLAKLYDAVTRNLALSDEEVSKAYQRENEKISIYYIAGLYSEFEKKITPSQENLKDYFAQHSLDFKQPPSFRIEYLALNSEDKIRGLYAKIKKNVDLKILGNSLGLEVKETGMLKPDDPMPGIGWSPQVYSLISQLKVGEIAKPILMDKTFYILKLKELKESYIPELNEVKKKVEDAFIKNQSRILAKEKIDSCLKKMQELFKISPKMVDFDALAKTFDLKSGETDSFNYGSYIEGIGSSDNFFNAAKALKTQEFSQIIDIPSGLYIIKLKSLIPVDNKQFQKEKEEFAQRLRDKKRQESFVKLLEELKGKTQISSLTP